MFLEGEKIAPGMIGRALWAAAAAARQRAGTADSNSSSSESIHSAISRRSSSIEERATQQRGEGQPASERDGRELG
jgi:hypothetical protein